MKRILWAIDGLMLAVALICLPAGHVLAREDVDGPITVGLWNALESAWPERWTVRARWVAGSDALIETPVVRESERIGVQQLISCTRSGRWTCALSHEELHIQANGVRHRTRARNVGRDEVVKIVDYVYSDCFYAQQQELGPKASFPRLLVPRGSAYKQPIYEIATLRDGVFEVATGTAWVGAIVTIEADPDDGKDCAFQLRSSRAWQRWS